MTNLQLVLTIAIPSMLILIGMLMDNACFNRIEARLTALDVNLGRLDDDLGRQSRK